ncbi:MAG: hypothetical protein ACRERD_05855 [Candidatus Binatia bacterium]
MEQDPILEELHRVRDEYAARFNYDLQAIYWDLKAREERGEFVAVYRAPRPPRVKGAPKKRATERGAA